MKYILLFFTLSLASLCACNSVDQGNAIDEKSKELDQREQQILVKEQLLVQKDFELTQRERLLDSASNRYRDSSSAKSWADSLLTATPEIPGLYNVTMKCTQTNCPGYAVGDVKNEQWRLEYEPHAVVVNAISDKKVVRVYRGEFVGPAIELEAQPDSLTMVQPGKIIVRLQQSKDGRLDGVREIIRQDDCRTVFELDLRKL